jgi:hypothetical protein
MGMDDGIYEVKRRHSDDLLRIPGVSGVGVTRGKSGGLVIAVYVDNDDAELTKRLPKEMEGYSVESIQSGPFRKL